MWRWTLYINPSAKLAGSAFKVQPQSDPLARLSGPPGPVQWLSSHSPCSSLTHGLFCAQWSFKKKVSSHDSTAQNPPVTPSDLDATTACDSHEICPGSSPARSPNLLAFPETCRTRSCHFLPMLYFLGCHSFQTPRIHSSLSPGLCSLSPSLTWWGK